jgi:hypothetical protein
LAKKDKGTISGDETNEKRSDKEDIIRRTLMILIIIGSFPILQPLPKVKTQSPPSEGKIDSNRGSSSTKWPRI